MKHTIEPMGHQLEIYEDKKMHKLNGYAFIDEHGSCIIIVYSENRRDSMSRYLDEENNYSLGLKYKTISL